MTATDHDAPPPVPGGHRNGWPDRPRHPGIGNRAEMERQAAEKDDCEYVEHDDEPTRQLVMTKRGDGALAITDDEPRQRYPLVDNPRFWDEEIRLVDFLELAHRGDYNLSHIALVRAANVAFFWLVTAPLAVVAFAAVWALAALHRALLVAALLVAVAQVVPFAPFLEFSAWSWPWVGGGVFVFGLSTLVAARAEPAWERKQERKRQEQEL